VDGALILSHHSNDRSYVQLARSLPVVFGGRPTSQSGADTYIVDVDNVAAAARATSYLLEHGRTRLATIAGPQNMSAGLDRLEGWRRALEEAGRDTTLVEFGDFSPATGAEAMERLLARGEKFDGVFIASAQMASGALTALREHGLTVPGDVAITTMDNDYYATGATPPLTTIDQPTSTQGMKIAETLVRLIEGEAVEHVTIIPTELIERDSV
jgi:LacI family transcriptional regulator